MPYNPNIRKLEKQISAGVTKSKARKTQAKGAIATGNKHRSNFKKNNPNTTKKLQDLAGPKVMGAVKAVDKGLKDIGLA